MWVVVFFAFFCIFFIYNGHYCKQTLHHVRHTLITVSAGFSTFQKVHDNKKYKNKSGETNMKKEEPEIRNNVWEKSENLFKEHLLSFNIGANKERYGEGVRI